MRLHLLSRIRILRKNLESDRGMNIRSFLILAVLCAAAIAGRSSWDGAGRVVAVGDVHGDFYRFAHILQEAGIIDPSKNWCAGKTHFVQTGDILDRGPDSRLVMNLLMKLEKQAPLQGGMVHFLIGNHESMLLQGDLRYVHPGEAMSHGGMKEMVRALRPDGRYGRWLAAHNSVITINNVLFLHAGLAGVFSSMSLETINEQVRKELRQTGMVATGILGSEGPLWYRGWATDISTSVERTLEAALETSGSYFAVVGHTVSIEGIATGFEGRAVIIDTGMSSCYGGPSQYLELSGRGFKVTGDTW